MDSHKKKVQLEKIEAFRVILFPITIIVIANAEMIAEARRGAVQLLLKIAQKCKPKSNNRKYS